MTRRRLEDGRRDQDGYNFLKETYIFGFFIVSFLKILYFCNSICPMRLWCHLWMTEPMGGALHIKKALRRFVFDIRNLGTSEYVIKNNAGVTPRGVVYTLRSVLRGLTMSSLAHFTGVYILQRGCFSVCLLHGFPKTSNVNGQMQAPALFICSFQ